MPIIMEGKYGEPISQKNLRTVLFDLIIENRCLQSLDWTTELSFMTFNSCLVGTLRALGIILQASVVHLTTNT